MKDATKVGGFDVIIDSAGGDLLNYYLKLVRPGGRIVVYGSTAGFPQKMDIFRLFWSQAQVMGSTMGNDQEFEAMVKFINENHLTPTLDQVYNFDNFIAAFDRFKSLDHFGKIVLKVS